MPGLCTSPVLFSGQSRELLVICNNSSVQKELYIDTVNRCNAMKYVDCSGCFRIQILCNLFLRSLKVLLTINALYKTVINDNVYKDYT